MIISLENISKFYSGEQVLKNIALTIEDDDRIGLIGINGGGKSTLLHIIAGLLPPDSQPEPYIPHISKNKHSVIGFLAQDSGTDGERTVIDEVKDVFRELLETAERLDELRLIMASSRCEADDEASQEYSQKTAFFEANDGYLIDVKINKVLNGMGFTPDTYERVISTLSGGEKTRLALAKLLLENPDLLILDEPTNHLDFDTIIWLEEYLREYKGALLIVSHDRYFLDKLITSTCEIERGVLKRFKGNYTRFTAQKAELVIRQLKEYEAQKAQIAKLKDYVERNIARASTSNMAKSRVKKLEAMEIIEKPVTYEKTAVVRFAYDRVPVKELLTVNNIDLSVGGGQKGEKITLIESLSFNVRKGEKLAVVGANGIGKSTLLKVIQGLSPYSKGFIKWGDYAKISYFEQDNMRLNANDTVINAVHRLYPKMTELEVRTLLGSVRLTGDNVYKKVGVISGGERAKLRFAVMMLERGNVLILDEPTNHLDIYTREILENALIEYDGTIIFVSHDRYLLNKLASRILEITDNAVYSHDGGFDDYIKAKRERHNPHEPQTSIYIKEEKQKEKSEDSPVKSYRTKEQRAYETKKRVRIKELEDEIKLAEIAVAALQDDLSNEEICADYQLLNEKIEAYETQKRVLSELTDEWLTLADNAEA
ncbi:MAG: ABC-F family ATP-binding cassette domain-containing protein [Oscillospiraceae bacterium]|nr:ABC-F family ATP-binding cassette domain-containing protein [Oscillospiraceae bacterium]